MVLSDWAESIDMILPLAITASSWSSCRAKPTLDNGRGRWLSNDLALGRRWRSCQELKRKVLTDVDVRVRSTVREDKLRVG